MNLLMHQGHPQTTACRLREVMYHDDEDLHMCINCHATIVGLENYLSHRNAGPCKQQAPVKENEAPISALPPLGMSKSEHIRSIPSATTPSSGDHLNFLNADFFFSSLELQSRRKDVVFEEVMGIEEVLEEEFEERESQGMVHVGVGKWGYEDYVQERDVWGGMEEKGREMVEVERDDMEGGHSINRSNVKKGGGKTVGVAEDREMTRKRRLRVSSEMEENNPDFIEGLGSEGDFSIGETSSKCRIPSRDSMLSTSWTQEFHDTSDAGNCNTNEFNLSLDSCGMEIGNPSHKDDDGSYERSSAAPPRGHTRGKWVPGSASEGMRKSENTVEYFCQPCNKNIRNRRSYETHLSTLCHLKKLMSSSNDRITSAATVGPRLRSRRLQAAKAKSSSVASPSISNHSTQNDGCDFVGSGDQSSQNYLMESLGIKRKVALSDLKEKSCATTNTKESITNHPPSNISSPCDKGRGKTLSDNRKAKKILNTKKNIKHRAKRKSKWKKGISRIPKGHDQSGVSQKEVNNSLSSHSNADSLDLNPATISDNLKSRKKSGDRNSSAGERDYAKESKSLFVEEKTSILAEDKFLPISDPHLSHGYFYDSLEIQMKQRKLKENLDLVKQKCDSSFLNSSENLQDQMMLGLELMRTEHLLSSSDKLDSKDENLSKEGNAELSSEIITKTTSDGSISPNMVSSYNIGGVEKIDGAMVENLPEARRENFNDPSEDPVDDEMSATNNDMVFESGKLSCSSVQTLSKANTFVENKMITLGNDSVIEDKSSQQSEGRHNSFFDTSAISGQSAEVIESAKESNEMSEGNNVSKSLDSLGTDSVDALFEDHLVLKSPKQVKNFFTLKLVKLGNVCNTVDFTCGSKKLKVGENNVEKTRIHHCLPECLFHDVNCSTSLQNSANSSGQLPCSVSAFPTWTKGNSKILIVKQNVNQIQHVLTNDNLNALRGQVFIIDKSATKKSEILSGSFAGIKSEGGKLNEDSLCDNLKEKTQCIKRSQDLVYELMKPKINFSERNVPLESECVIKEMKKSYVADELASREIVDEKKCKYSTDRLYCSPDEKSERDEHSNVMMSRNMEMSIASCQCAPETPLADEKVSKDVNQFHCESVQTISDEKREQIGCDIDQVSTVECGKGDDYFMALDDPVAYEEVCESSLTCSDTSSTINVVINIKSTAIKSDQVYSDSMVNGESDGSNDKVSESNLIQDPSSSHTELLPNRALSSMKLGEKSMEGNPCESNFGTTHLECESAEQVQDDRCDDVREKSATDILAILTNGKGITQQNEPGKAVLYCCRLCKYKSDRYWCVERHMKKHFPRDRPYSCNKCNLSFLTLDNLKQHLKRHKKKRWFCSVKNCSQAFSTKQELLTHISGPHVEVKSFKCGLCEYSGKNHLALIRHKKLHEEQGTVKCETCSQVCKKGSLSRHMKMHAQNDLYHCPFCPFTSYYLTSVHRHVTHSGFHPNKMLYNCPFCPVIEEGLEKHEEMEHSYCLACSSFSTNNAHEIMDHINSAHKDERTYSYLYSNVSEIMRRIHTLLGIICPSDI